MTSQPKYLILSILLLLGSIDPSYAAPRPVDPKVLHIINRLSFGPRPGDIQKVESIGVEAYIKEQLAPNSIPQPVGLTTQLSELETLHLNPVQLREYVITAAPGEKPTKIQRTLAKERTKMVLNQAIQARLLRATNSPQQLQEIMVDFWYNHFNVDANKERTGIWAGAYEQEAIRPYVFGRFRDLLGATAHHPAMLFYLDNYQNRATKNSKGNGKVSGLNENYARELMELHTLGVDGGYTQQDVIALAKILSGWGISKPDDPTNDGSGFQFNPKNHDFSDKVFLGHKVKGRGKAEGEEALDILARSPVTARYISYKIAQYFVADRPPSSLIKNLSQTYLKTDGNIHDVLNALFQSPEFWDEKNFNSKFKTPYQYAISAVRATGIEVKDTQPINNILNNLAMPVYRCPTPDGYKNTQDAWLNSDAMTRRLSFATAIANGTLPLSSPPKQIVEGKANIVKPKAIPLDSEQIINTLGNYFSDKTQSAIADSTPQIRTALILGSPEFMRR